MYVCMLIRFNQHGNKMYGATTSNIVEQFFSWVLEERHLTPYYQIKNMLLKILKYNTNLMNQAGQVKSYLNTEAEKRLTKSHNQ